MTKLLIPDIVSTSHFKTVSYRARPYQGRLTADYLSGVTASDISKSLMQYQGQGVIANITTVVNYSDSPLIVIDKNNIARLVPPLRDNVRLSESGTVRIEIVRTRNVEGCNGDLDLHETYAKYLKNPEDIERTEFYKPETNSECCVTRKNHLITYIFTDIKAAINTYGGYFYHKESDLVIVGVTTNGLPIHPSTSYKERLKHSDNKASCDMFSLNIYLNDPLNTYGRAYVNIAGIVQEIPVTRNTGDKPEIFIGKNMVDKTIPTKIVYAHYPLDDENVPIKVYHTAEDAATYGNPEKIVDLEIQRLKAEAVRLKAELDVERGKNAKILEQENLATELAALKAAQIASEAKAESDKKTIEASFQARLDKLIAEKEIAEQRAKLDKELLEEKTKAEKKALDDKAKIEAELAAARANAQKDIDASRARQAEAEAKVREEKARQEGASNQRNYEQQENFSRTENSRKTILEILKLGGAIAAAITAVIGWLKFKAG